MAGDLTPIALAIVIVGVIVSVILSNDKCPKCGRWGARIKGKCELQESTPDAYSEWQRQKIGEVHRASQTMDQTFGPMTHRSVEASYADVEYRVTTMTDYYLIPCHCKHRKCGHEWEIKLAPVIRVISRERVS